MTNVAASRANTLDGILEELPDFSDGYFSYPVDEFFPNYVEALGQQGRQDGAIEGNGDPLGTMTNSNGIFPQGIQTLRHVRGPLPTVTSMEMDSFDMQEPAVFLPQLQQGNGNGNGINYSERMMQMPYISSTPPPGNEMHSEGSGSGIGSVENGNRPSRGRLLKSNRMSEEFHIESGDGMDSDDGEPGRKNSKAPGKAKRNAKQQAQNKQAQQRYRERRKQRFNDMEHAIDELNTRLAQMQAIQSQNNLLVAKSQELETMLAAKDQELNKLRGQVQESGSGEESSEQRRQAEEAIINDFQGQAANQIMQMKEFIEKHKLRNVSPTGEGVKPEILQQMAEMLGSQCGSMQTNLRADGVKILRLMSADMKQLGRIKCVKKVECVGRGLQDLQLTDLQKGQLLLLRTNHLNNLKEIYVERQQLNMQAMAFMLPSGGAQTNTLESKLERMRHASFRRLAAQTVGLDEILTSIKDNLRREQKRVMEMNFVTLHRILSPIQAGLYVTGIYPMSFDALELANMLAIEVEGPQSANSGDSLGQNPNTGNGEESSCTTGQK